MKLEIKNEKIKLEKDFLDTLTKNTSVNINQNIKLIENNFEKHNDLIDFVDIMNIFEVYNWINIKHDYIKAKKMVTKCKNVVNKINKLYGNLANYYPVEIQSQMNLTIKELNEKSDLMFYNYCNLKKLHYDVHNKCKYLIKNPEVAKIYDINEETKPVIIKIYQNYMDNKLVQKQLHYIKTKKLELVSDMNNIMGKIKSNGKIENYFG